MNRRYLYICLIYILFMGSAEAICFLDVLKRHDLLSRRTVAQYVLPALFAGEGTDGYRSMEASLYGEILGAKLGNHYRKNEPSENSVSHEAADYLRRVLATISEPEHGLSSRNEPYNGFSETAYAEVYNLLGENGRRHLGIYNSSQRLNPSRRKISTLLIDEGQAEDIETSEGHQQSASPEHLMSLPEPIDDWPDSGWKPEYPELEPFPLAIGQDKALYTASKT